jgi:hypothetical protein
MVKEHKLEYIEFNQRVRIGKICLSDHKGPSSDRMKKLPKIKRPEDLGCFQDNLLTSTLDYKELLLKSTEYKFSPLC